MEEINNEEKEIIDGDEDEDWVDDRSDDEVIEMGEDEELIIESNEDPMNEPPPDGPQIYLEDPPEESKEAGPPNNSNYINKYKHSDSVFCIQINKSHPICASGDMSDTCKIWNYKTLSTVTTLNTHSNTVIAAKYSADKTFLCTASLDNSLHIHKVADILEEISAPVHKLSGPSEELYFMSWHPTGNAIMCGGQDMSAWVFNANNGQTIQVLSGHTGTIISGDFLPSGKLCWTASEDNTIRVWKPQSGESKVIRRGMKKKGKQTGSNNISSLLSCACVYPNTEGDLILGGTSEGEIIFVNTKTAKVVREISLSPHPVSMEDLKVSSLYHFSASAMGNGDIAILDLKTGKLRANAHMQDIVVKVYWSMKGDILYACSVDGTVAMVDYRSGSIVKRLSGHTSGIMDFDFDEEENILVTAGDDAVCLIFDIRMSPSN